MELSKKMRISFDICIFLFYRINIMISNNEKGNYKEKKKGIVNNDKSF